MADSGGVEMWRQVQMINDPQAPWSADPDNKCRSCGRKTTTREHTWIWANAKGTYREHHGIYCEDCGPPRDETRGPDIAAQMKFEAWTGERTRLTGERVSVMQRMIAATNAEEGRRLEEELQSIDQRLEELQSNLSKISGRVIGATKDELRTIKPYRTPKKER